MPKLVIVESPAKANTINKYLGPDYQVMASYGHIRDLPAKNGSVDPAHGFRMVWELDGKAKGVVRDITKHLKQADELILATDPDREGEAISWHIYEVLREDNKLPPRLPVKRVVFNEITKSAVQQAMANPRAINTPLVDAYLARRALDYLVGFTLSPVLWRKLPGSRSAGRVQSVALRVICEREAEIEAFVPQEYWSVEAQVQDEPGKHRPFKAHLWQWHGQKMDRLSVGNQTQAAEAKATIEAGVPLTVARLETRQTTRHPQPPFITSTLQQEASRKLGFSVTRTMQTAQRLYEGIKVGTETVGLITYMRTDGVNLSQEALTGLRTLIGNQYGARYLPQQPRVYKTKAKNAQEAHEAIRPTDIRRTPQQVQSYLNDDQFRLYELIWKRTVACQMASAELEQVAATLTTANGQAQLRATGSVITFDGFLKVYQEGRDDDPLEGEDGGMLPPLTEGQRLTLLQVDTEQHFTRPPPRYTEASLVKRMEELGIGRPSTYASIIRILQDRQYVRMESRRFIPQERGRLVTVFLMSFFPKYVEYDFTASLEEQLDDITSDRVSYLDVLTRFWQPFLAAVENTKELTITDVLNRLEDALGEYYFPTDPDHPEQDPRNCPTCQTGRLSLKLGRFGAFIGCSNYPTCNYTRQITHGEEATAAPEQSQLDSPKALGNDPATGKEITLNKGPYGVYLQLGQEEERPPQGREKKPKKIKPKRASLPEGVKPAEVTLEFAVQLLSLPRELGQHPETGEPMKAGLGRFGPYVQVGTTFVSLKKEDDVFTIGAERAVELLETSGKKPLVLGQHNNKEVSIRKGRFGHYIQYGKLQVPLPRKTDPATVTLEDAAALIDAKALANAQAEEVTAAKTTSKKPAAKGRAAAAAKSTTSSPRKRRTSTAAASSQKGSSTRHKTARSSPA